MTVANKLLHRFGNYFYRLRSRWYMGRFLCMEKARHKQLVVGEHVCFNVPVRGEGEGTLIIGNRNTFGYRLGPYLGTGGILLQARHPDATITIGDANAFSNNVAIVANEQVLVRDGCQIGDQVVIYDCDFHEISPKSRVDSPGPARPVVIGNNVWLGSRAMVLKGVTIGDNSVIGAMSVVTKSVPANCIAAGNPAKVIRAIER
jgi:maltose O-acetyltransferase